MTNEKIFLNLLKAFHEFRHTNLSMSSLDKMKKDFAAEIERIKAIETADSDKAKLQQYIVNTIKAAAIYTKFYENQLLNINEIVEDVKSSLNELKTHDYNYYDHFGSWDDRSIEVKLKDSLERYNRLQESKKTRKKIKGGTLLIDYFNTNPTLEQLMSISILTSSGKKLTPIGRWGSATDELKELISNKSYHALDFYYKEGKREGNQYHGKIENLTVVF